MRIGVWCPDFYPSVSGYSFAFQDLVKGLCAEGAEVDVFTDVDLAFSAEIQMPGLNVIRVRQSEPLRYIKYLRVIWNLFWKPYNMATTIASEHVDRVYDALLFETIEDPLVILYLPASLRARSVVRVHGCSETERAMWDRSILWRFKRSLIARTLRSHVRYITATCDYYIEFVKRHFLDDNILMIADKRFAVVPNSAPTLRAKPPQFYGPKVRKRFITLGRMDWVGANQKGFDDIIMALSEMTPKQRSEIHLTLIGQGDEQCRLRKLVEHVPEVEVEFISNLPNAEVRNLICESDAVILASRYEGMSVFALEAVATGAPVIFSNAGGIANLVRSNGKRFVAGDPTSLAAAWVSMLDATPKEFEDMSMQSLAIASELTPQLAARKLIRFLRGTLYVQRELPSAQLRG